MSLECNDPRCSEIPTLGYHDFSLFVRCQELVRGTDLTIVICEDCFLVRTPLSSNMVVKQVTTLYGYLRGFLAGRTNEKTGSHVVNVDLKTTICRVGTKGKMSKKTTNSKIKMTKRNLGPWVMADRPKGK